MRLACAVLLSVAPAAAQAGAADWKPEKPVEFISGVAAGGAVDIAIRSAQKIFQDRRRIPQPITVVNRPGSGSAVAWNYMNTHAGDGHFLSMTSTSLVTNSIIGTNPLSHRDVTPIVQLSREYIVFSVREDSPLKTGRDLVERLKKDPGSLSFGLATSRGNPAHVSLALVARAAGVDVRKLRVAIFTASPQAITNLLGGHLDVVVSSLSPPLGQLQAGRMRSIAVAAPSRLTDVYASVPTWKEMGLDVVSLFWRGVIGPKGMTPAQVAYWESEFGWLVNTDEWKKYLVDAMQIPDFQNSRDTVKFLEAEYNINKTVLTELGLAK